MLHFIIINDGSLNFGANALITLQAHNSTACPVK